MLLRMVKGATSSADPDEIPYLIGPLAWISIDCLFRILGRYIQIIKHANSSAWKKPHAIIHC